MKDKGMRKQPACSRVEIKNKLHAFVPHDKSHPFYGKISDGVCAPWLLKKRAEKCRRDIQNESRILMVDQLWMWILDADTIITCFSKRYGSNKQDISAVHKSIRIRMQDSSPDQVRTAFDLGLIIIDECINTLFDQIKTAG